MFSSLNVIICMLLVCLASPAIAAAAHKSAPRPNPIAKATATRKPSVAAVLSATTKEGPGLIAAARWIRTIEAKRPGVMRSYTVVMSGESTAFIPTE